VVRRVSIVGDGRMGALMKTVLLNSNRNRLCNGLCIGVMK